MRHLLVSRAAVGAVVVDREDVILALVDVAQLGASKCAKTLGDCRSQRRKKLVLDTDLGLSTAENIGGWSLRDLEEKAFQVVAVKQISSGEDTRSQRSEIDSEEAVRGTSVSANVQEWRVPLGVVQNISKETWNGVLVADRSLVPVIRDSLPPWAVLEVSRLARNGEERHELFLGETAFRESIRVVCHHADWEGKSGRRYENT